MPKERKPDFIEVTPSHVISTKGIMSIRQRGMGGDIEVRYISGYTETVRGMSMCELLDKLGRNPLVQGGADSGPTIGGV